MGPIECEHPLILLGTHPDFKAGWVCAKCKEALGDVDLQAYAAVVFVAIKSLKEPSAS